MKSNWLTRNTIRLAAALCFGAVLAQAGIGRAAPTCSSSASCSDGFYCPSPGSSCSLCPAGYYCKQARTACPTGTYNPNTGPCS